MGRPQAVEGEFADLLRTFAGPMRRLCAAYEFNPTDREDLFQEIALAVWRALPSFRRDASTRTWFYRIAHNVALSWQRKARRTRERELAIDHRAEPFVNPDFRRLALQQAVARLNPAERTVAILWLEGLTAEEIEEVTGVKAATVAVKLSRLRKRLASNEVAS